MVLDDLVERPTVRRVVPERVDILGLVLVEEVEPVPVDVVPDRLRRDLVLAQRVADPGHGREREFRLEFEPDIVEARALRAGDDVPQERNPVHGRAWRAPL
jgi:hypothetical protein